MNESLGEALPRECARVRNILGIYRSLPNNAGAFGAAMIEQELAAADKAMISGDVVAMIAAYKVLKEIEA